MADNSKLACARKALEFVTRGMSIGLGTGSTAAVFIDLLGKRNKEDDLDLTCVATSRASEEQAKKLGLKLVEFSNIDSLDAAFDGADQVDPKFNLIKGLGGALVREKIVDYRARRFYVLVGENKLVKALSGIVPVEVIPMSEEHVRRELVGMGASSAPTRVDGGRKFVSDNGNFILHADFKKIPDPSALEKGIMPLPGVVDNGIFTSRNVAVIVGKQDGTSKLLE
ncbi:MAG: ribose-5-phosphate isomerase RpiA [Candidatus Micrarchaeota archaeon]|nr:ribose-5-phosphate isomerase RpiA [Candidatus Micrarchaeota archaeon]